MVKITKIAVFEAENFQTLYVLLPVNNVWYKLHLLNQQYWCHSTPTTKSTALRPPPLYNTRVQILVHFFNFWYFQISASGKSLMLIAPESYGETIYGVLMRKTWGNFVSKKIHCPRKLRPAAEQQTLAKTKKKFFSFRIFFLSATSSRVNFWCWVRIHWENERTTSGLRDILQYSQE